MLGDACISLDRLRKPVKAPDRRPGPFPYYGASGIVDWVDDFIFEGPALLVSEDGENLRTRKTPIAFMATGRYWVNNHAHVLRAADGFDLHFIHAAMQIADVAGYLSGSTQPKLTASALARLPILFPPLIEQKRIATVLGAFDALIETNRLLVDSLDRRGRDLCAAVTAHGAWTTIGETSAVIETGRRPRGGVAGIASGMPSVGAESIVGLGRWDFGKTKYVPLDFAAAMKQGRVQDGDVLVYKDGGKPGDFKPKVSMAGQGFPFDDFVINEHVYRVRAAGRASQGFLYFWLQQPDTLADMRMRGTGAAIPGLNRTAFNSVPVRLPPPDHAVSAMSTLDSFASSALSLAAEAANLTRTRDELLPLLMSGRVRVAEAEMALDAGPTKRAMETS